MREVLCKRHEACQDTIAEATSTKRLQSKCVTRTLDRQEYPASRRCKWKEAAPPVFRVGCSEGGLAAGLGLKEKMSKTCHGVHKIGMPTSHFHSASCPTNGHGGGDAGCRVGPDVGDGGEAQAGQDSGSSSSSQSRQCPCMALSFTAPIHINQQQQQQQFHYC